MTRNEQNQFTMMQSVHQFLTINELFFSNNSSLMAVYKQLKVQIDEIDTHSQVQAGNTKADSALKLQNKENIIETVLKVLAGMGAHGASINDTRLKMASNVKISELRRLRDADFVIKIRAIYEIALPIAIELGVWGVEKTDIDSLDRSPNEYMQKSPGIRNVKAKTVQATTDLKLAFDTTNTLIKSTLDPMMLPFKTLKPTFHGEYLIARAIIDLSASRTKEKPKNDISI
jgi:hypothetical protein